MNDIFTIFVLNGRDISISKFCSWEGEIFKGFIFIAAQVLWPVFGSDIGNNRNLLKQMGILIFLLYLNLNVFRILNTV